MEVKLQLCSASNAHVITNVIVTCPISQAFDQGERYQQGLYRLESQPSIRQQRGGCGFLPGQLTSASAFTAGAKCYKCTHPKQGKISFPIVKNRVVGCGMPHSIVEQSKFWQFRKDLGLMWDPIFGKWIAIVVSQPGGTNEGNSETFFFFYCCVTLHLWSDRRMRSFILYTS